MKNILVFFAFFLLFACDSLNKLNKSEELIACPDVFFSGEHRDYIHFENESLNLQNISYSANINNYDFIQNCSKNEHSFKIPIDILIVAKPIKVSSANLKLPIYTILLDENDDLIETQYFLIESSLTRDSDNRSFVESEIYGKLEIVTSNKIAIDNIIVGFMINEEKSEFID